MKRLYSKRTRVIKNKTPATDYIKDEWRDIKNTLHQFLEKTLKNKNKDPKRLLMKI